ncbi:thermonuclease family protein [Loktanella sp. Alg231-35]|uniref:thermonuclease family protein n=1 Tax=Loktanella sp. Alg231-35 TaxID=1922220 RepID=UPI000D554AB1|nr:thermonuclease family protein [Loktanella sp. Alg231-35]
MIESGSIYVVDGDTIDIEGKRFRLVGYDTPETYRAGCAAERALGNRAMARLRELIATQTEVALYVGANRDKFDRGLARLVIGNQPVADSTPPARAVFSGDVRFCRGCGHEQHQTHAPQASRFQR